MTTSALWDDADEFFYDVLHTPDGRTTALKVRSMVGLIPLFAVETLEPELLERVPEFAARLEWFLNYRPDLAQLVSHWDQPGRGKRRLLSLLRGHRMKKLLVRHARPERVPVGLRRACALKSARARAVRVQGRRRRSHRATTCRPSPTRRCSAATPIGAARSGSRSNYLHHRVAAEVSSLLRRRFPGRVPDRLRPAVHPRPGRRRRSRRGSSDCS